MCHPRQGFVEICYSAGNKILVLNISSLRTISRLCEMQQLMLLGFSPKQTGKVRCPFPEILHCSEPHRGLSKPWPITGIVTDDITEILPIL